MKVPFLDLTAYHASIRDETTRAIQEVIDANAFVGSAVERFEKDYATYCGSRHAIGVSNGSDAIWLSLAALGVGPGDEVITVPNTYFATAGAISRLGAKPVFVDVDPATYTMDPKALPAAITKRTRAIIPVHLYGHPADMDSIRAIASRHGLFVVEDACQAHGAEFKGQKAGTLGDVGCFSFYPGKNIGAFGEAGAVVTNDTALAKRIRALHSHGQTRKNFHTMIGSNCRMDALQAAVLRIKLQHLDSRNRARRRSAILYNKHLKTIGGIPIPRNSPDIFHVFHLYVIRVPGRDALVRSMARRGITCGIHYPVPIHLQPAYRHLKYGAGSFPISERLAKEVVSLPMFPELTPHQIEYVVACLGQAVRSCVPAET